MTGELPQEITNRLDSHEARDILDSEIILIENSQAEVFARAHHQVCELFQDLSELMRGPYLSLPVLHQHVQLCITRNYDTLMLAIKGNRTVTLILEASRGRPIHRLKMRKHIWIARHIPQLYTLLTTLQEAAVSLEALSCPTFRKHCHPALHKNFDKIANILTNISKELSMMIEIFTANRTAHEIITNQPKTIFN
jgi:hypothetical protein